jgi:hypothetical protein
LKINIDEMHNLSSKNIVSPILMAIAVWVASLSPVGANPGAEPNAEQIEQATQATEIKPGDWAYQTLQALSSKYSCGNTPQDNKILSRDEFATSLNGCVQSIEELVARRPRRAIKKRKVVPAPAIETPPPAAPENTAPPAPATVEPPAPQVED